MSDAVTLLALADRCERETPAFILDVEIAQAIGWPFLRLKVPPAYTASLDAAVTLVPAGVKTAECVWNTTVGLWTARLFIPAHMHGQAKTEPMARCAAALRAKAAMLATVPA